MAPHLLPSGIDDSNSPSGSAGVSKILDHSASSSNLHKKPAASIDTDPFSEDSEIDQTKTFAELDPAASNGRKSEKSVVIRHTDSKPDNQKVKRQSRKRVSRKKVGTEPVARSTKQPKNTRGKLKPSVKNEGDEKIKPKKTASKKSKEKAKDEDYTYEYEYEYEYDIYEYEYTYDYEYQYEEVEVTDSDEGKKDGNSIHHIAVKKVTAPAPREQLTSPLSVISSSNTPPLKSQKSKISQMSDCSSALRRKQVRRRMIEVLKQDYQTKNLTQKIPDSDFIPSNQQEFDEKQSQQLPASMLKTLTQQFIRFKSEFAIDSIRDVSSDLNEFLREHLSLRKEYSFVEFDQAFSTDDALKFNMLLKASDACVIKIPREDYLTGMYLHAYMNLPEIPGNITAPFFKLLKTKKLGSFEISCVNAVLNMNVSPVFRKAIKQDIQKFWADKRSLGVEQRSLELEKFLQGTEVSTATTAEEDQFHYVAMKFVQNDPTKMILLDPALSSPRYVSLSTKFNFHDANEDSRVSALEGLLEFIRRQFEVYESIQILSNVKSAQKLAFEHFKAAKYRIQEAFNFSLAKLVCSPKHLRFSLVSDYDSFDELRAGIEKTNAVVVSLPKSIFSQLHLLSLGKQKISETVRELGERLLFLTNNTENAENDNLGFLKAKIDLITFQLLGNTCTETESELDLPNTTTTCGIKKEALNLFAKYRKLPRKVRSDTIANDPDFDSLFGLRGFAFDAFSSTIRNMDSKSYSYLLFFRARERNSKKIKIIMLDSSMAVPIYVFHDDKVRAGINTDTNFVSDVQNYLDQLLSPVLLNRLEKDELATLGEDTSLHLGAKLFEQLGMFMLLLDGASEQDIIEKVAVLPESMKEIRRRKIEKDQATKAQREAEEQEALKLKEQERVRMLEIHKLKTEAERDNLLAEQEKKSRLEELRKEEERKQLLEKQKAEKLKREEESRAKALAAEEARKAKFAPVPVVVSPVAPKEREPIPTASDEDLVKQKLEKLKSGKASKGALHDFLDELDTNSGNNLSADDSKYFGYLKDIDEAQEEKKLEEIKQQRMHQRSFLEKQKSDGDILVKNTNIRPHDVNSMNTFLTMALGVKGVKVLGQHSLRSFNADDFKSNDLIGLIMRFPQAVVGERHAYITKNLAVKDSNYYLVPLPGNDYSLSCANAVTNLIANTSGILNFQPSSILHSVLTHTERVADTETSKGFGVTQAVAGETMSKPEISAKIASCVDIFPLADKSEIANPLSASNKYVYSCFVIIHDGEKRCLYELEGSLGDNLAVLHGTANEKELLSKSIEVIKAEMGVAKKYTLTGDDIMLYPVAK